ncbi:hypothetical protein VPH35_121439 [Triticum aestivum]
MSTLEQSIRKFAEEPTNSMIKPEIGTSFDSLGEAYDFYNLYSWEVGFGIRYGESRLNAEDRVQLFTKFCDTIILKLSRTTTVNRVTVFFEEHKQSSYAAHSILPSSARLDCQFMYSGFGWGAFMHYIGARTCRAGGYHGEANLDIVKASDAVYKKQLISEMIIRRLNNVVQSFRQATCLAPNVRTDAVTPVGATVPS